MAKIILFNSYDARRPKIPDRIEAERIDWYQDDGARERIPAQYGNPSSFPAVIDTDNRIMISGIKSWGDYLERYHDKLWGRVRDDRDKFLADTDWMVLPDVNLAEREREEVLEYRQELRDLPEKYDNPEEVKFPKPPGFMEEQYESARF